MKYMHFNSSCAYAGLANLLLLHGIDTEDAEIALEMQLPYLFAREGSVFLAGPMLQTGEWFDLYLRPRGLRWQEERVPEARLCAVLAESGPCMLGLHGHAVVFRGMEQGRFSFWNNKWEQTPEPERLLLDSDELLAGAAKTVSLGRIVSGLAGNGTTAAHLRQSAAVLRDLGNELTQFCETPHTAEECREAMNPLFRPILLDAVTMLGLLGEQALQSSLAVVQRAYLQALRAPTGRLLAETLPMDALHDAMGQQERLILRQAETLPDVAPEGADVL